MLHFVGRNNSGDTLFVNVKALLLFFFKDWCDAAFPFPLVAIISFVDNIATYKLPNREWSVVEISIFRLAWR